MTVTFWETGSLFPDNIDRIVHYRIHAILRALQMNRSIQNELNERYQQRLIEVQQQDIEGNDI